MQRCTSKKKKQVTKNLFRGLLRPRFRAGWLQTECATTAARGTNVHQWQQGRNGARLIIVVTAALGQRV